MTDIIRSNYQQLLPEIKQKIKDATFISFDAEFSGLGHPPGGNHTSLFDSGEERYGKMRDIVMQNNAPQVGFSIFRRENNDAVTNIYHVDSYQAYVSEPCFAQFNNRENIALSLEYKCGKFLRKCNFDFNAFAEKSVPYLNYNRTMELVQYLHMNPNFLWTNPGRYYDPIFFPKSERAGMGKRCLTIEDINQIVKRLRGLSEIADVIREQKIPLVGHNFGLDLLYFIQMFCNDLPEDYESFKQLIGNYFSGIYDTKFMILSCRKILQSHPAYKNNQDKDKLEYSSLFTAFLKTSQIGDQFRPIVKLNSTCAHFEESLEVGRKQDLEVEKHELVHSPGFDSCTTGILFLNVSHIVSRIDKHFDTRTGPPTLSDLFVNVQSWKDQVFISRAAVLAMYLSGNDPNPCRPRWMEANSMQKIDMVDLKKVLTDLGPVDIVQIDNYTIRFAAAGGKSARQMKKLLSDKGYKIKNVNIPFNKAPGGMKRDEVNEVYDTSKLLG